MECKNLLWDYDCKKTEFQTIKPGHFKEIETLTQQIEVREDEMIRLIRSSAEKTWIAFIVLLESKSGMNLPLPRRFKEPKGDGWADAGFWNSQRLAAEKAITKIEAEAEKEEENTRDRERIMNECWMMREILEKFMKLLRYELSDIRDFESGRFYEYDGEHILDSLEDVWKMMMIMEGLIVQSPGEELMIND